MAKTPPPRRASPPRVADLVETSCLHCALRYGRAGELHHFTYRHELQLGSRRFRKTLKGTRCAVCGHGGRGSDEQNYLTALARQLADEGDRQPEVLRFIREQAYFASTELASLLGVSRQSVHRWESGKTPIDLASYAVLRLLFHEALRDQGTPLRDWLEKVNGLPRRRLRGRAATLKGHAPALDKLGRQAQRGQGPAARAKGAPAPRPRRARRSRPTWA